MSDTTNSVGTRTVGLVASQRQWRSELHQFVQDHITGLRIRVLRDPRAVDADIDVVLIDDSSTFLNRASLRSLTDSGVHLIGIYDPTEQQGQGQAFLNGLGIDNVAVANSPTEELVALIRTVTDTAPSVAHDEAIAALVDGAATLATRNSAPTPGNSSDGVLIAVGGPASTAAVEIGVNIAAAVGARHNTVIIDVDEVSPCVAPRLRHRLEPSVLDAIDLLHHGHGDLTAALTQPTDAAPFVRFNVIAGIANPDDWSLLGRRRASDLLAAALRQAEAVVAVCGTSVAAMPQGVDRFGASRAAVADADHAIVVMDPNPVGVLRGLDTMIEARRLRNARPCWAAFAGHPKSAVQRRDLVGTLRREAGDASLAGIVFIPFGKEVSEAAWAGSIPARGRFVKSINELAAKLMPVPTTVRRGSRLRSVL